MIEGTKPRPAASHWRRELIALGALLAGLAEVAIGQFWAQHLIPQIGLLCLACAGLCLIGRAWLATGCWAAAAVVPLLQTAPLYFPQHAAARPGCRISVLTFNQQENPPDNQAAAHLIAQIRPDILFAEKVYAPDQLRALLSAEFPGYSATSARQLLILSRFPLSQSADVRFGLSAVAAIGGRQVRLLAMYMTRASQSVTGYSSGYEHLYEWLSRQQGPLIVAGDGNSTAFSSEMRSIRSVLRDSWDEAGWGLGATFPGPWRRTGLLGPILRIDYILHDGGFDAVTAQRIDEATGAGHYPVRATLVLAGIGEPGAPCPS